MADKSLDKAEKLALKKEAKEANKKAKLEKKALKKEANEAKKKAKLTKKSEKASKEKPDNNSEDKSNAPKKKNFFTIKKLIIFSVVIILIMGSGFFVYKMYFSSTDEPIVYKSVTLKNVNLPDEMLKFSFDHMNDLYFSFATYDLRVYLLNKEIERINKIGENYPDQNNIAEKEKKNWIKAKEKVDKKFFNIEKQVKELYVLYNVNKDEGKKKVEEKSKELLLQANEALESLDSYIKIIKANEIKEPQGIIKNTIYKIKKIL